MKLAGRVALITGGGRGIGRAAALALATEGADIAVSARSAAEIEAVAGEVRALGRRAAALPCDVTVYRQCEAMVGNTIDQLGRLDILMNNAGEATSGELAASDPQQWTSTILTNLAGVYYCTRAALP